jgi:hypothetical protein
MKNHRGLSLGLLSFAFASLCLIVPGRPLAQDQIQKAKIFEDTYQMITDTDLYGSFYMLEEGKPLPDLRIIGAELMNEKEQFSDSDIVYLSKGQVDGLEIGQLFQIIGLYEKVPLYGTVVWREGRARVIRLEEKTAVARIEKSYWPCRVGDYAMPFEESEGEIGKDKGYDQMDPNATKRGQVVFIDMFRRLSGTNQWASVNLGRQQCVQIGDQLAVFHRAKPDLPREAFGSMIIIDVRGATSTVKILSCRDAIMVGDEVQLKTAR